MSCQLLICTRRSMYRIMLVLKRTSASDFFFFISRELFFITMLEEVRSRANGSGKINKLLQWIACECVHYHLDVTRTADSKKKKKSLLRRSKANKFVVAAPTRGCHQTFHITTGRNCAHKKGGTCFDNLGVSCEKSAFLFFFLHKTRPKGCDQTQWARLGRCAWLPRCPQERKGPVSQRV